MRLDRRRHTQKAGLNQSKCAEIAQRIAAIGDDPGEFLEITYRVAERKYTAWPESLRTAFKPACTLKTGNATLSLTLIGNPALQAEGKIQLTGLRDPVGGEWLLQRVEHQLDGRGFVTRIEAETPNR